MAAALSGDEIDRELIKLRLLSAAWVEIINQFRKLFENDLIALCNKSNGRCDIKAEKREELQGDPKRL